MTNARLHEFLRAKGACSEARSWIGMRSAARAWRECPRGDWLIWAAATLGVDRKLIVRAACACARLSLRYVPDGESRPLRAIELAEAWTCDRAAIDDVRAAAYATDATDAAAAVYAARAAAYAAYAAYAVYAAYATDAADAVYAAYATDAAASLTRIRRQMARAVRKVITLQDVLNALRQSAGSGAR